MTEQSYDIFDNYLEPLVHSGTQFTNTLFSNCVLSGSDLLNCTFSSCMFVNVNFSESIIRHSVFDKCLLVNVTFSGSNLTDTSFGLTNLVSVIFKNAVLYKTNFRYLDLRYCDFEGANYTMTDFRYAVINNQNIKTVIYKDYHIVYSPHFVFCNSNFYNDFRQWEQDLPDIQDRLVLEP